jgi:hypothetical protein
MPRFTARNVVVAINILLLTALFVHLRHDKHAPAADLGLSHMPDELFDDSTRAQLLDKDDKTLQVNTGIKKPRTAVVVASQASENATWLSDAFPHWTLNMYRVDDPTARLTVPKNKGRESMVYLTYGPLVRKHAVLQLTSLASYIIDHYDHLPDYVLFVHPNRYQWHNDDPDYDGLPMLRHFQLPYLEQEGYVNIRCAWSLGCPSEIKPLDEEGEHREAVHAGGDYKQAFQHLFPGEPVPREVGVSCCAQFAATKEKIWERKKSEYERYRKWIMDTNLSDSISGRILEYSWHSKSWH